MKNGEARIEITKESLLDIIEAQNELIAMQEKKIKELEEKLKNRHTPAQIENGVIVKLGRVFI